MTMKVAIYGVGMMGAEVAELLVERDISIVAAFGRSPSKVGLDLGTLIGLDRELGVIVSDDPETVLRETKPDIAIISTNSYLVDNAPFIETCVRAGVNVLTIAEEGLHPWRTSPELANQLDQLAKEHGVSIYGGGHEDTFWISLGTLLAGVAHRVDAIRWTSQWNPDAGGPELMESLGLGEVPTTGTTTVEWQENTPQPPFGLPALDAVAEHLGLPDAPRTVTTEPIIAETPVHSSALGRDILPGEVLGWRDIVRREPAAAGEPLLEFTITALLQTGDEPIIETWAIEGRPSITTNTELSKGHFQVTGQTANRLQDVIDAAPGWVRHSEMPPLRLPR